MTDIFLQSPRPIVPSVSDIWDWCAAWGDFLREGKAARLWVELRVITWPENAQWDGAQVINDLDMVPKFERKVLLRESDPWPLPGMRERDLLHRCLAPLVSAPTTFPDGWRLNRLLAQFVRSRHGVKEPQKEFLLAALTPQGLQLYYDGSFA